tara:strand:+ start:696 stop:908 length:213 start_codon:yes stop_codon:yes gene_type:complete
MAIRKGKYQDFFKIEAGRYRSKSGKTIIENAALFHEDGSTGWWAEEKVGGRWEWVDVYNSLKEALSFKWK